MNGITDMALYFELHEHNSADASAQTPNPGPYAVNDCTVAALCYPRLSLFVIRGSQGTSKLTGHPC